LPSIFHYWSDAYVRPSFEKLGLKDDIALFADPAVRLARAGLGRVRIASVGPGDGALEIAMARRVLQEGAEDVEFHCYAPDGDPLARVRRLAEAEGLAGSFRFIPCDLNRFKAEGAYDLFMANQSLHGIRGLERLFDTVREHLAPGGSFVVAGMIGRNGHRLWPEAYAVLRRLWRFLPPRCKRNQILDRHEEMIENRDCSLEGDEGIRTQDILPLLVERFRFELFYAFGCLIFPFVGRSFGPNFDAANPFDRRFIEMAARLDRRMLAEGLLKPAYMIARMTVGEPGEVRLVDGRTPRMCIREPDA
jgi:SAM-dependent methyltransferase